MYLINGVYVGPRDIRALSGSGVRRYTRHGVVIIIKKRTPHARTHTQKTMHHLRNEFARKLATDLVSRNFTPGGPNGERCRRGGAGGVGG